MQLLSPIPEDTTLEEHKQIVSVYREAIAHQFDNLMSKRDVVFESRHDSMLASLFGSESVFAEIPTHEVKFDSTNETRRDAIKLVTLKCMLNVLSELSHRNDDIRMVNETIETIVTEISHPEWTDTILALSGWKKGSDTHVEVDRWLDLANLLVFHLNYLSQKHHDISEHLNGSIQAMRTMKKVIDRWNGWMENSAQGQHRIRESFVNDLCECYSLSMSVVVPPLKSAISFDTNESSMEETQELMHKLTDIDRAFTIGTGVPGMNCFLDEEISDISNTNWKGAKQLRHPEGKKGLHLESAAQEQLKLMLEVEPVG